MFFFFAQVFVIQAKTCSSHPVCTHTRREATHELAAAAAGSESESATIANLLPPPPPTTCYPVRGSPLALSSTQLTVPREGSVRA